MLMLAPVMRSMERIDMPSTSMESICARFSVDSLFMRSAPLWRRAFCRAGGQPVPLARPGKVPY